jgi:Flp pilus assembly protein TadB
MEQIALLNESYTALLGVSGIFFIGNILLLWMMFRGVTNANLHGVNTFGKVMHSIISLCVVAFNMGTYGNVAMTMNNWAFAVSETGEELTGGLQQFVDSMGATEYVSASLIPTDPLGIVFYLAILVGLIGGMWAAPEPKE